MTLARKHLSPNTRLFHDVDRLFHALTPSTGNGYSYDTDFYETDSAFVLELAIPGIKRDDVDINLEGRTLNVKADYKNEQEDEGRTYHVRSMQQNSVSRTVKLPESVDPDSIQANFADGLLKVTMQKHNAAQARKIALA